MTRDSALFGITAPRQARSREAVGRILDATVELLEQKDFREITINDLCLAADVSTSSFYMRFRNKEAVLHVIFDQYQEACGRMIDELAQILLEASELSVGIEQVIRRYTEFVRVHEPLRNAFSSSPELRSRHDVIDVAISTAVGRAAEALGGDLGRDPETAGRIEFAARSAGLVLIDTVWDGSLASKLRTDEDKVVGWLTEMVTTYVYWTLGATRTDDDVDLRTATSSATSSSTARPSGEIDLTERGRP